MGAVVVGGGIAACQDRESTSVPSTAATSVTSTRHQTYAVPGQAPQIRLISKPADGEWHLPAGDYANTRYSPLDQIRTTNVAELKAVTTMSTGINRGHEGNPLVVGKTMYVVRPFPNNLIAIDLERARTTPSTT